jgi:hypothetical protein
MKLTLSPQQVEALSSLIDREQTMFTKDPLMTPTRVTELRAVLDKLTTETGKTRSPK